MFFKLIKKSVVLMSTKLIKVNNRLINSAIFCIRKLSLRTCRQNKNKCLLKAFWYDINAILCKLKAIELGRLLKYIVFIGISYFFQLSKKGF